MITGFQYQKNQFSLYIVVFTQKKNWLKAWEKQILLERKMTLTEECPNAKLATNYRKVPAKYKTDYTFKKIVFHSKEK